MYLAIYWRHNSDYTNILTQRLCTWGKMAVIVCHCGLILQWLEYIHDGCSVKWLFVSSLEKFKFQQLLTIWAHNIHHFVKVFKCLKLNHLWKKASELKGGRFFQYMPEFWHMLAVNCPSTITLTSPECSSKFWWPAPDVNYILPMLLYKCLFINVIESLTITFDT